MQQYSTSPTIFNADVCSNADENKSINDDHYEYYKKLDSKNILYIV